MVEDKRIAFALAQLSGRLHTAVGDKRCGCAPCKWWVHMVAKAAGVSRQRLESHLPEAAKPQRPCRPVRPMTARVCDSGAGIALMLDRLHQQY